MGYYNHTGRVIPMMAQRKIIPDGAPLQLEFSAPERRRGKAISINPKLQLKRAHGLQLFGIQREGQAEL